MTRIILRAVPERQEFVDYLQRHIPDLEVAWDRKRDPFDTLDMALAMAGGGAAVHIEDDILLTCGFREKLEREIAERPNNVIQFFSMRKADIEVGSRWDRNYIMFQCTYFPAGYSSELRAFCQTWKEKHPEHPGGMDLAVRDFLKSRRERYWIVCPSLVEHRVVKSTISPAHHPYRQSKTFKNPLA